VQALELKDQRALNSDVQGKKMTVPASGKRKKEFAFPLPFCSI
jgi:hypothetical protein